MRCLSCNALLSNQEATVRFTESNSYVDLCSACRRWLPSDVSYLSNDDESELPVEDIEEFDDFSQEEGNDEDLL